MWTNRRLLTAVLGFIAASWVIPVQGKLKYKGIYTYTDPACLDFEATVDQCLKNWRTCTDCLHDQSLPNDLTAVYNAEKTVYIYCAPNFGWGTVPLKKSLGNGGLPDPNFPGAFNGMGAYTLVTFTHSEDGKQNPADPVTGAPAVAYDVCANLFHELAHAADIVTGSNPPRGSCTNSFPNDQTHAIKSENDYRRCISLPLRQTDYFACPPPKGESPPTTAPNSIDQNCCAPSNPNHGTCDPSRVCCTSASGQSKGFCSDLTFDGSNCGSCGNVCQTPVTTCYSGSCQCPGQAYDGIDPYHYILECPAADCGGSAPCCADLWNDPHHCGACGWDCYQASACIQQGTCTACSCIHDSNGTGCYCQ